MGQNGHGRKWLWAEMVMGRNDLESIYANLSMLNDNHNYKLNIMYWLCLSCG